MRKRLLRVSATLLLFGCLAWAGGESWTGVVSDSHCGAKHATASDAAAGCVNKCVEGGAKYVLVDAQGDVYALSDQRKPAGFAGKPVVVAGHIDPKARSIHVHTLKAP